MDSPIEVQQQFLSLSIYSIYIIYSILFLLYFQRLSENVKRVKEESRIPEAACLEEEISKVYLLLNKKIIHIIKVWILISN